MALAYERMRRYPDAAVALRAYLARMPREDTTVFADRLRSEIEFFESFDRRLPYAVSGSSAGRTHTVAFKLVAGKIVVKARVNGGPLQDFIVDTGAEQVVLSNWTARHLGVYAVTSTPAAGIGERGVQELQQARIATLDIGDLEIRNVPCLIREPAPRTPAVTERLSPVAMGFSTVVDYARRTLTVADDLQEQGAEEGIELPLWMYRLPIVRGMVDGLHPAGFVVDTGGEAVSIGRAMAADLGRPEPVPKIHLRVFGASGLDREAYLMPFVHLAFGPVGLPNYSVAVLDLDVPSALLGFQLGGVVGYNLLCRYRVAFDLRRGVLRLTGRDRR